MHCCTKNDKQKNEWITYWNGLKKSTQEEFNIAVKREMHKNNE